MSTIERHYRWLLRAYPASYRAQRGGEILGTLMEAAPARRWPSFRDARALILGGLRVRAGQDRRLGTRENLRLAALLGVALSLIWLASAGASSIIALLTHTGGYGPAASVLTCQGLILLSVAAAWFAPWRVTAPLALVTAGLCLAWNGTMPETTLFALRPAGLLALLALLARGRERLPRHWLALAGSLITAVALQELTLQPWFGGWYTLASTLPWVILGVVVLWAAVDARPALAMALTLVSVYSLLTLFSWAAYRVQPRLPGRSGCPRPARPSWPSGGSGGSAARPYCSQPLRA